MTVKFDLSREAIGTGGLTGEEMSVPYIDIIYGFILVFLVAGAILALYNLYKGIKNNPETKTRNIIMMTVIALVLVVAVLYAWIVMSPIWLITVLMPVGILLGAYLSKNGATLLDTKLTHEIELNKLALEERRLDIEEKEKLEQISLERDKLEFMKEQHKFEVRKYEDSINGRKKIIIE